MKAYTSIREAVSDLKARTGHGYVSYFVNGTQVGAADYRRRGNDLPERFRNKSRKT